MGHKVFATKTNYTSNIIKSESNHLIHFYKQHLYLLVYIHIEDRCWTDTKVNQQTIQPGHSFENRACTTWDHALMLVLGVLVGIDPGRPKVTFGQFSQ